MKSHRFKSVVAITAFAMLGASAFAGTATKPSRKELKQACIAELQPPVVKGERLTPEQGEKVRECIMAKSSHKAHQKVAERAEAKKENPTKAN